MWARFQVSNEAAWNTLVVPRPRFPAPHRLPHGIGGHPARLPRVSRDPVARAEREADYRTGGLRAFARCLRRSPSDLNAHVQAGARGKHGERIEAEIGDAPA